MAFKIEFPFKDYLEYMYMKMPRTKKRCVICDIEICSSAMAKHLTSNKHFRNETEKKKQKEEEKLRKRKILDRNLIERHNRTQQQNTEERIHREYKTHHDNASVSCTLTLIGENKGLDYHTYFDDIYTDSEDEAKQFLINHPSGMKFSISLTAEFTRGTEDFVVPTFITEPLPIYSINQFRSVFENHIIFLQEKIANFQEMGSDFIFNRVLFSKLTFYEIESLKAGTYIPSPFKSKWIINIKNEDDYCFVWSILAKLHYNDNIKDSINPNRVSNYRKWFKDVNISGIKFPIKIQSIDKFELQNSDIAINVYELLKKDETKDGCTHNDFFIIPKRITNNTERKHVIDLLLLKEKIQQDMPPKRHYALITDIQHLVTQGNENTSRMELCRRCLTPFSNEKALKNHQVHCNKIKLKDFTKIRLYKNDEKLYFNQYHFKNRVPFVLYGDFEAINKPVENDPRKVADQIASSYFLYLKSDYEDIIKSQAFAYRGEDCIENFAKVIKELNKELAVALKTCKEMIITPEQEEEFNTCINCYYCGQELGEDRVKDHNHYNGLYRGASHNECNLKAKKPNFVPILFHNLSRYDGHFIIKELKNQKVTILPKTAEDYISFNVGCIRFLDSLRFFQDSLDNVSKSMIIEDFKLLQKYFPDQNKLNLIKRKGIFPYDYIKSHENYEEEQLPPKEKFHSILKSANLCEEGNCTCISDKEYRHAQNVFETFECKNIGEYNDLYNMEDTLLLADCFEKFREINLETHNIDPCYCYSIPGLSWQSGLKFTKVELDYIYDEEVLEIMENGIRGGICGTMGTRYVKANNKYLPDYDKDKESLYLLYEDANNLYGWSMSESLPYGDFKLLTEDEIESLNVMEVGDDSDVGYILECDLEYPDSIKLKTRNFPFLPERMKIDDSKLSDYQLLFKGKSIRTEKLVCNQYDKKNYIIHYRMLKFYLRHGIILKKIHRAVSFKQSKWLEPYITYNTKQRSKALTEFLKNFHKLCNNAFFGKTCEDIRNRVEIKFASDRKTAVKYYSKSNFIGETVFDDNLSAVHFRKKSILFDKPIYVGDAVLDLSKLKMYESYYDVLQPRYGDNIELLAMDTDSFMLAIKTDDLYKDMSEMKDYFDFSDYPNINNMIKDIKREESKDEYDIDEGVLEKKKIKLDYYINNQEL
jgi:hypothetical protein